MLAFEKEKKLNKINPKGARTPKEKKKTEPYTQTIQNV